MKLKIGMGVAIVLLLAVVAGLWRCWQEEKQESRRQAENVRTLTLDVRNYKVRDSLSAGECQALRLKVGELEELRKADVELIKELKMRPKEVEYVIQTETVTKDSLVFVLEDSCFSYEDKWARFDVCLPDSSFHYEVRDSISHIISRLYKHKFLWWKWGTKGYKVTVVNHNPRGKVSYQEVVKVEK